MERGWRRLKKKKKSAYIPYKQLQRLVCIIRSRLRAIWMWSHVTCSGWLCLSCRVSPDDLQRSFQPQLFGDFVLTLLYEATKPRILKSSSCITFFFLSDNSDLIACTVITKDGGQVQRFLAVDIYQMSLVEPDVARLGWGVVKFAGLLQVRKGFNLGILHFLSWKSVYIARYQYQY